MLNLPSSSLTVGQKYPDPPISGVPVWRWDGGKWIRVGAGALSDAPLDGNLYARRSGQWDSLNIPEIPEGVSILPVGGQLRLIGSSPANRVGYYPFNGAFIRIAGEDYPLPTMVGGVSAAWNNAFIDGVGGQSLAFNTTYFVYVFDNGGTLMLDFSTTGHQTSATSGNAGIEIKQSDDSRTLVGIVYVTDATGFRDDSSHRLVRSWLNRNLSGYFGTAAITGFNAVGGWAPAAWAYVLMFNNDSIQATAAFSGSGTAAPPPAFQVSVAYDGIRWGVASIQMMGAGASASAASTISGSGVLSEGYHTMAIHINCNGGMNGNAIINGLII